MNYIRIFIIAVFLPTALFPEEKAHATTEKVEVEKEKPLQSQQEPPPAQATQQATQKTQDVTVNGAGITFILLAVGGIIIAVLQNGGSIAH